MDIVFYSLIIAFLNTLTSHTLLTRKRSIPYCVIAFILNTAFVYSGVFMVLRYVMDPVTAKYIIYFLSFLYIFYMLLVFSESYPKKVFTMFSIWTFSTVVIFIAIIAEKNLPEFLPALPTLDTVFILRYIIQTALIFLSYLKFSDIYRRVLDIIPDRTIRMMSLYLIMGFALLINSIPKIDSNKNVFSSFSDIPLFLAYVIFGYLVVFVAISSSSEVILLRSSLKKVEKQSEVHYQMANFDSLTGIANRMNIFNQLSDIISGVDDGNKRFAVLLFDVDNFKSINDRYGHLVGDQVLKRIAQVVHNTLRNTDSVGRFGGDEFIIIQQYIRDQEDTVNLIDRVFEALKDPFITNGIEIKMEISIGISVYPDSAEDLEKLIQRADKAMYDAKKEDGCSFCFYEESDAKNFAAGYSKTDRGDYGSFEIQS